MSEKILLDAPYEYEAQLGEVLEMHFKLMSLPLLQSWQRDQIIGKLSGDPHYRIISITNPPGEAVITVEIVKNPFPLLLLIGGAIAVFSGFFIWASLGRVYKIIETPTGKVATYGAAAAVIGLVIVLLGLRS